MSGAISALVLVILASPTIEWLSSRFDPGNTAAAEFSAPPDRPLKGWSYQLREQLYTYQPAMTVWTSPALFELDGRPVVAAGACDHRVYVFDAYRGEMLWRFSTGGGVFSAPVVSNLAGRSVLFAASSDRTVYALDARTGERLWSRELVDFRPTLGYSRLTSPAAGELQAGAAIFVGYWVFDSSLASNFQEAGLVALEAATGRELWRARFLDQRLSDPLFYRHGVQRLVLVASADGNLRALEAERGQLLWSHREMQPILSAPLVFETEQGPRIVIGGHLGKLRCLDALSGEEKWSFAAGSWIAAPAAVAEFGGKKLVVFGTYQNSVFALDTGEGKLRWRQYTSGPVYSAPAVVNDPALPQVIFAAWDHQLYGLSLADGKLLWKVYTGRPLWDGVVLGDSLWGSPAVARTPGGWMIYFGSYSGVFQALSLSQAAQAASGSPWSNLEFFVMLFATLVVTAILAVYLSRRRRNIIVRENGHQDKI